jgi:predicted RND superfamily exporter protein
MPHIVRFPNISFKVANVEAVTEGSRVAGFVTKGPTTILSVAASICEYMTYGSSHKICESKVHACVKPSDSAISVISMTRLAGGFV